MVIASNNWIQNASCVNQDKTMTATGILSCHDISYPFQERTLSLEQPVKIGRSVARARAANDNAIFDCKVLSRNHALLWYDSGKFFLKDTKSSNGTFVNNKRLSPSGEESSACEICSGDVVQFGVDVVESTKKVTHGCIVATLKLYLPDGKEAKASFATSIAYVNITLEDLYKLHQFIQDAGRRENALRSKLEYMQQLLEHTRVATSQSWKALVLEDCLLSRLEMLENQVLIYSKNYGEDQLRLEFISLLEDKAQYQNATKKLLKRKVLEKKEIVGKTQVLKARLNETKEENQSLQSIIKHNQTELQELAVKYVKIQQTLQDTDDKLNKTKIKLKDITQQSEKEKQEFLQQIENQKTVERNLQINLQDSKLDSVHIYKQMNALKNYMQTIIDIELTKGKAFDSINFAKPIDVINIILNKWRSFDMKITNSKSIEKEKNEKTFYIEENNKLQSLVCFNHDIKKNDSFNNLSVLENKYNNIITPEINKTIFKTSSENESNYTLNVNESEFNFHRNKNITFSEQNFKENENIPSVKLIMRMSSNVSDDSDKYVMKAKNELTVENFLKNKGVILEYEDSENIFNSSNKQMKKVSDESNNIDDVIKDSLSDSDDLKYLQHNYATNSLKLHFNNFTISKYSQQFILQNLLKTTKMSKRDYFNNNQNIINEELQCMKKWLSQESNEVIIEKLKNYYYQVENENKRAQELYEQLIILKEKYNSVIEEKTNAIRKNFTNKAQHKFLENINYKALIYYLLPFILLLFWMLINKIL